MSLFKERANNSKLVIALRNEIINYKNQIKELSTSSNLTAEFNKLKDEHANCMDVLSELEEQLIRLKGDIKKLKAENTRLKKKLTAMESSQAEQS